MAPRTGPTVHDWLEIAVQVAGIDCELAADVLRQACPGGVAIEPAAGPDPSGSGYLVDGAAPALVKGYLPSGPDSSRLRRSLRLALSMAPLQAPPHWRRPCRIHEQDWRHSWKRYFGVQRISPTLVVKPSWVRYGVRSGETVIEIDPGMAFGTGQHPTTAICLRALEELVRPGNRVLDLGTGSGILAIAAAKLGAAHVLALDVDPLAVKTARQNADANGVADRLAIREGSLDETDVSREPFDLIVANISGLTIERLAAAFARSLQRGGILIVGGFLADAVEGLARAFRDVGLAIDRVPEDGIWRAMVARRPACP